jgi:DNA-binding XRE family transcriptional regulator
MKHDSPARRMLWEYIYCRFRSLREFAEWLGISEGCVAQIARGMVLPSWRTRLKIYQVTGIPPAQWGPPIKRDHKLAAQPLPRLPRYLCSKFSPVCAGQCPRDAVSIVTEGPNHE